MSLKLIFDGLFGNCQKKSVLPKDTHVYRLNKKELLELEQTLWYLVKSNRSWRSSFAQCILINSLIAYRHHARLDLGPCRPLGRRASQEKVAGLFPSEARSSEKSDNRGLRNQEKQISHGIGKKSASRRTADRDVQSFDRFLSNLSPNELEHLKEFVIKEENESAYPVIGRPVKKSPPVVTKVVVHYTPGNDESSESANEIENDSKESKVGSFDDEDLATAEQMFPDNEQKILESTDKEKDEDSHFENTGQQQTDMLPNPLPLQHLPALSSSGPRLGVTTTMSLAGAQGKYTSQPKYEPVDMASTGGRTRQYLITMYFLCGMVGVLIATAMVVYLLRRHARLKDKISRWAGGKGENKSTSEYQDLCRQHMQVKFTEKVGPVHKASHVEATSSADQAGRTVSTGGSTSTRSG